MAGRRNTLLLVGVLLLLLAGGAYLGRDVLGRVNFSGSIGAGGQADVRLPPGFAANVFAAGLNGPRFIAFGPDGVLVVAERGAGRLVALPDADGDGRADAITPLAEGLDRPHSLAYHEGAWYVGLPGSVVRVAGDGVVTPVIADLPADGAHSTRTVAFLPDGRLVVSIGSSCNVCVEDDPRRAALMVYDADGSDGRLFASGLRNAVGLAIQPETGALWASNNGRDLMGDDTPPETVYVVNEGDHFGWPACHAGDIPDPDYGGPGACQGVVAPVVSLQAHMAPLALLFYDGQTFPDEYRGDLFIALHGSWNRPEPVGYKVMRVPMDGGAPAGPAEDFATGWLDGGRVSGRPVGLAVGPDGALYVSDDRAGFIYRIAYAP